MSTGTTLVTLVEDVETLVTLAGFDASGAATVVQIPTVGAHNGLGYDLIAASDSINPFQPPGRAPELELDADTEPEQGSFDHISFLRKYVDDTEFCMDRVRRAGAWATQWFMTILMLVRITTFGIARVPVHFILGCIRQVKTFKGEIKHIHLNDSGAMSEAHDLD